MIKLNILLAHDKHDAPSGQARGGGGHRGSDSDGDSDSHSTIIV